MLQIDFRSGLPIYTQIVNQVQTQVAGGVLKPGDQLPTVRALAEELRVNFNTIARAYRLLDEARIISTQQGRGTYITEIPPPNVTEQLRRESLEALTHRFISEAMRLNLWPKFKIVYPTEAKGQLYIPAINLLLFLGCVGIVLYFRKAANMEAAYGLAITLCMIATSVLFANFLVLRRTKPLLIYLYLVVFLSIEFSFLYANMEKFPHGGYVALIVGGLLFLVMYDWFKARKIKNRYVEFVRLDEYVPKIQELSNDRSVPKYATHLVYLTSADNPKEIEHKIIYSILGRKPKRADIYWFVHVDTVDSPYTAEYTVEHVIPNDIIRVEFRLGFRVQPRINLLFKNVVENLVNNREVNVTSRYESQGRSKVMGDFQFVVLEKYLSQDNDLPIIERMIMKFHFYLKEISLSEEHGFGLDPSSVTVEKFPLIVSPVSNLKLKRVY